MLIGSWCRSESRPKPAKEAAKSTAGMADAMAKILGKQVPASAKGEPPAYAQTLVNSRAVQPPFSQRSPTMARVPRKKSTQFLMS